MKTSSSPDDRKKEGVRLILHGAKYPPNKDGKKQQAVIDFLCDRKEQDRRRTRTLSRSTARDEDEKEGKGVNDEDDSNPTEGQETDDGEGGKLEFLGYDGSEGPKVLSLKWTTKYACEDSSDKGTGSGSGHWGFFTWLIIM